MDINVTALTNVDVTGKIQILSYATTLGLYMSDTAGAGSSDALGLDNKTTLKGVPLPGTTKSDLSDIAFDQLLGVRPNWSVSLSAVDTGELAYSLFGGGWNTLTSDTLKNGKLDTSFVYDVEETDSPSYVINTGASAAQQQYISAIFSGYQLGIIGLQTQSGQQVPAVSGIVGASDAPVTAGRVFGDLSKGLPASVSLMYKTDNLSGPVTPSGLFGGALSFATFDTAKNTLGTPVPLLPDVDFSELDVAVSGDYVCLFAVTGDGAPLLAVFDSAGAIEGSAAIPAGSWSGAGRWVTNPTITATPGAEAAFSFAFIEMKGSAPSGVYSGTLTIPPTP